MTTEKPTELSYNPHMPLSQALLPRIVIEDTMPTLDGGQFAIKAGGAGRGGDQQSVCRRSRQARCALARRGRRGWHSEVMTELGNNSWQGQFRPERQGRYLYCIEAWIDHFASFQYELEKKHNAAGPGVARTAGRPHHGAAGAERSDGQLSEQLAALHHELSGLLETEQVALFLHSRAR
jgi:starch synthase (maltosyl-transferring)